MERKAPSRLTRNSSDRAPAASSAWPWTPTKKPIAASAFIELRVVPPAPAAAVAPPEEGLSEKGLLLTPEGGAPVAVADTRRKDWLSAAGVKEGQSFTLEGYFDAPEEAVYQFQVRGNVGPVVEVDGRTMQNPKPDLQPRMKKPRWPPPPSRRRRVDISARLAREGPASPACDRRRRKDPTLDIRFGGRGTQSIGADFKHARSRS